MTSQWRNSISNHQRHDCLLHRLFRRRSKKTSRLRVTGLCAGNSPLIGEFPAQMTSSAENVSIWWRHHDSACMLCVLSYDIIISYISNIVTGNELQSWCCRIYLVHSRHTVPPLKENNVSLPFSVLRPDVHQCIEYRDRTHICTPHVDVRTDSKI